MSMRTLLAVLDPHASNRTLLEAACAHAADWKARLEALLPYPQIWNPSVISVADETAHEQVRKIEEHALALERALGEKTRAEFTECCADYEIPVVDPGNAAAAETALPCAHWISVAGFDRGCRTVDHARLADLVLARRPDGETGEGYANLIGLVLRGSARPVMLVPPRMLPTEGHEGFSRIAIAWNGSAEGVHAVSAALGLIEDATTVDILTARGEQTGDASAERLVDYLACHGIEAGMHIFSRRGNRSTGEMILDRCDQLAADLLVTGATTHNRWRDLTFGGVTRHVMDHAELPVFMAQ